MGFLFSLPFKLLGLAFSAAFAVLGLLLGLARFLLHPWIAILALGLAALLYWRS